MGSMYKPVINEQGIYGDENVAEEIRQKRHEEAQFKIQVI